MDISSIFDILVWLSFLKVFLFAVPVVVSLTVAVLDSMVIGFSMLNDTRFGLLIRDWSLGTDCALSSCEFRLYTLRVSLCQLVSRCVKCWLPFVIGTTSDRDRWSMIDVLGLISNFLAVSFVCMSSWRYQFVNCSPGVKYADRLSLLERHQIGWNDPWSMFWNWFSTSRLLVSFACLFEISVRHLVSRCQICWLPFAYVTLSEKINSSMITFSVWQSSLWKLFWFWFLTNFTFTIRLLISMICWLSFHNLIQLRAYFGVVKLFRLWAWRKICSIFS